MEKAIFSNLPDIPDSCQLPVVKQPSWWLSVGFCLRRGGSQRLQVTTDQPLVLLNGRSGGEGGQFGRSGSHTTRHEASHSLDMTDDVFSYNDTNTRDQHLHTQEKQQYLRGGSVYLFMLIGSATRVVWRPRRLPRRRQ